jgi:hypothetical protein
MFWLLLLAFGLTAATVVIHALGTLAVIAHLARTSRRSRAHGRWTSEVQIVRAVSVLLLLHLTQATAWASVYRLAGLLPDMETAVYFSMTSYTTVGYGDVVLSKQWRLLGPIEGAVGILMFGWSTGVMVTLLNRVYGDRLQLREDLPREPNISGPQ